MAFLHSEYDVKEEIREIVKEHYQGGDILSLPADNFLFEQKFPFAKITCCERDPLTYVEGLKRRPSNVTYLNQDIFTVKGKFGLVWFDLCGAFQVSLINTLISYFQQSQSKVICLTILAKREGIDKVLQLYGAKDLEDFRVNTFPELISSFSDYRLSVICRYLSPNRSPMLLYVFKLKNKKTN
jgi:hypothetical protein